MNAIRVFKRHDIQVIKNMLEIVPDGATHVTDDMRMFVNENSKHAKYIADQIDGLARISELKRLVESVDKIDGVGGIDMARLLDQSVDGEHLCIDCGSSELYSSGEIKEPKMCFDCFAAMVGFTNINGKYVDMDEVQDEF